MYCTNNRLKNPNLPSKCTHPHKQRTPQWSTWLLTFIIVFGLLFQSLTPENDQPRETHTVRQTHSWAHWTTTYDKYTLTAQDGSAYQHFWFSANREGQVWTTSIEPHPKNSNTCQLHEQKRMSSSLQVTTISKSIYIIEMLPNVWRTKNNCWRYKKPRKIWDICWWRRRLRWRHCREGLNEFWQGRIHHY